MKGKVAFVLGAAVGYVLGTRAGRERYEQIKRGAKTLWNSPAVQRGSDAVRGIAQERVDQLKDAAIQAGKNFVSGAKAAPSKSASSTAPPDAGEQSGGAS